jgi:hypothetical protein
VMSLFAENNRGIYCPARDQVGTQTHDCLAARKSRSAQARANGAAIYS